MWRQLFYLLSILSCMLILPANSVAAETSIVIETTGEAFGSDMDSPREMFERARSDAQRKALEQATGTFIAAHSVVTNGQLSEDLVHAVVRGKLDKVVEISRERAGKDHNNFIVKIRATVSPVSASSADGIRISAALSKAELLEGDEVRLQYKVSQNAHVYLFVIGADNSVTQLLPNAEISENSAGSGQTYFFPPEGSNIRLKAQLLPESSKTGATEKIKIIATRKEEPLLHGAYKEGFRTWSARETGLASDLLRRLSQLEAGEWGETTVVYRIAPK